MHNQGLNLRQYLGNFYSAKLGLYRVRQKPGGSFVDQAVPHRDLVAFFAS